LVALVLMYAKRIYPPPTTPSVLLHFRPVLGRDMHQSLPKSVCEEYFAALTLLRAARNRYAVSPSGVALSIRERCV
jgi:hypothetical protein